MTKRQAANRENERSPGPGYSKLANWPLKDSESCANASGFLTAQQDQPGRRPHPVRGHHKVRLSVSVLCVCERHRKLFFIALPRHLEVCVGGGARVWGRPEKGFFLIFSLLHPEILSTLFIFELSAFHGVPLNLISNVRHTKGKHKEMGKQKPR